MTKAKYFFLGEIDMKIVIVEKNPNYSRGEFPMKYLRVLVRKTSLKKEDWSNMIEKIQKKLEGSHARFLSLEWRITLINSVLSAMPLYQALVYKIPRWVIKNIDKIQRKFLWARAGQERKAYSLVA